MSRIHPELRSALYLYRAKMRFRVFLFKEIERGMTIGNLAKATGLPEEQVKEELSNAPKNPLDSLSSHEHRWLLDYYNNGQRL